MERGRAGALVAALVAVRVVALTVLLGTPAVRSPGHVLVADVTRYREVARLGGLTPRGSELPPGAVAAAKVVDARTFRATTVRLGGAMLVVDLATAGLLAWGFGVAAGFAYLLLGLPLIPFVYFRLDLLSVFLATAGVLMVERNRPRTGGAVLALATLTKLWPAALVGLMLARRRWQAVAAWTVAAGLMTVVWVATAGTDGPLDVVTFRHARGLHVESVVGSVVRAFQGGAPRFEAGAQRTGPVPGVVRLAFVVALALLLGVIWWQVRRASGRDRDAVGRPEIAVVTAVVVCAPLLSPQYVAWILPWAAVAAATGDRVVERLTLVAGALTTAVVVVFGPLRDGAVSAQALLLARNAVLVTLLVVAMRWPRRTGATPVDAVATPRS